MSLLLLHLTIPVLLTNYLTGHLRLITFVFNEVCCIFPLIFSSLTIENYIQFATKQMVKVFRK